jgi:hypothetical protein
MIDDLRGDKTVSGVGLLATSNTYSSVGGNSLETLSFGIGITEIVDDL